MKKILSFLYSTRLMALLFIGFAVAMGVATFIENDFGTQTAKALVYNAWWFEAIMVFFIINFFGNIFRYRLISKEKWPVLVFHLAFLFILIGAGVTRYIGYEGIMLINEGETTNTFLSETTYVNMVVDNNEKQKPTIHEKILLSAKGGNSWSYKDDFLGQEFEVKLTKYLPWAIEEFQDSNSGDEYLFLVESSGGSRHEHYIKKGSLKNVHGVLIGFENPDENASIKIFRENGNLKLKTKDNGTWLRMADQKQGAVTKDSVQQLQLRSLYNLSGIPFVIPDPIKKGSLETVSGPKDDSKLDLIVLDVTVGDQTEQVELYGGKFNSQGRKNITVNGLNFGMMYGSKIENTPFQVKLNDFQLEKYPGSESAASFASEITVIDPKEDTFDYRIYMNHILDYKGYKFYQASYDLSGPTEQTHLSVNHDFWGTLITYIGYSLLYFGMISILFAPGTRFDFLKKQLNKIKKKKAALTLLVAFTSALAMGQDHGHKPNRITEAQIDSILMANKVSLEHAEAFNKLVIQDAGGRMKPAHTFASELIRKVHKKETFKGFEPSQILLSIIENPRLWFEVPFISLGDLGNKKIREIIGVSEDATHARLSDFYTDKGESKIAPFVAEAQKKNIRNSFEKDFINIEKRIYVFSLALSQSIMRIYPIPGDENNKWVSQPETSRAPFKGTDSVFVRQAMPVYMQLLQAGKQTGDYTEANKLLDGLKKFQKKYGAEVYPSEKKLDIEIAYTKMSLFTKLFRYYGLIGFLLILVVVLKIFYSSSKFLNYLSKFLIGVVVLLFLSHTAGLIARWYISGHAPWGDAYESFLFVSWATLLFGLYLGRKSDLTIGAATFVACVILMIAKGSWLDPEIANLVPVLNSWWVVVHVPIIVGSYGPFSLSMILGIVSLFLIISTNSKNKKKMELNIREITVINEMSMTIGVIMLTIGNFLGGMWANESWGRYWGWDPKETWALISIMIYAFVLHMRLIPGLRGKYIYNLLSIVAYGSVMMTYMGVNFYLSGLHSYASGDKVITPSSVYYSIAFVAVLGVLAWFKNRKFYSK